MEVGDSVFFLKQKSDGISNIIAKGTVVAKEKNVSLAKKTWGLDNDETWEQLFYLNDVELTQITVYHKNLVKKSGENFSDCAIQGSSIIDKTNPNYNYFINLLVGDITYPSETNDPCDYREGSQKKVFVNKYERNQIARNKCIELKGSLCLICGFNFGTIYGEDFKEFIHVHHLIPLHEIGKDYEINPEKDLIPICPNCHAAIHILLSKCPNLTGQESVEQLRSFFTK